MEMLLLYNREYSSRRGIQNAFGSKSNFLEKIRCLRVDQHIIEGTEGIEIIPPLACSFSTVHTNLVAVADEDGGVLILDINKTGLQSIKQDWRAHKNAIFDVEWTEKDRLLTASGDQTVRLWDVVAETSVSTFKGHASSVKTVRSSDDPNIFATGARDGHVMVWDARVRAKGGYIPAINTIQNAHTLQSPEVALTKKKRKSQAKQQQNSQQTVTAVEFQDDLTLITSGSADGSVKVWDLRKNYSILRSEPIAFHKFSYAGTSVRSHGFSSLALDSTRTRLFANCMDNTIYLYDCATYSKSPVATYRGHTNSSFYVKTALSPDDVFLLSGSTDKNAYIWRVEEPTRSPLALKGHADEVSAVAWNPSDYTTLVTVSDDCTVCTWRVLSPVTHDVADPAPGQHVVGSAEWTHKDIGVDAGQSIRDLQMAPHLSAAILAPSRSLTSPVTSPSGTPRKTSRPKVTGVSPKVTGVGLNVVGISDLKSPPFQSPKNSLTSPLLQTSSPPVFTGTPGKAKGASRLSPPKSSPRFSHNSPLKSPRQIHVLLSPRKTPIPGCFDALSPRKTPCAKSLAGSGVLHSPQARSVKRKLCDVEPEDQEAVSKRHCSSSGGLTIHGVTPLSTPTRPFAPSGNITPAKASIQQLVFGDTPDKLKQSPTINLPNYVLNPEPRTPQAVSRADSMKENSGQCKNWLSQLRQSKRDLPPEETAADSQQGTQAGDSLKTPTRGQLSSTKKAHKGTPRSAKSKTPTATRRSIMSYFSPKDSSKK